MPVLVLLALALAAGAAGPPGAHAHAGDLVLRQPAGGGPAVGAFVAGEDPAARARALDAAGANPLPPGGPAAKALAARRSLPHHFVAPGFDPARSITSAAKLARGRLDVAARARRLAEARDRVGPARGDDALLATVPGQDTVRIAFLRVDFTSDREGSRSTGDGRFDLSPRDTINRPLDPTPHDRPFWQAHGEALSRYWHAQSAGRTVVEVTTYPTARDSAFHLTDMADYGPWKFSPEIYRAAVDLFRDCLVAADTTETIPWSTFDRIFIIHAGSDLQSDVFQDSPLDIPTFTIGVADTDVVVVGNPAAPDSIYGAVIAPETIRQDGYEGVVNAVYAHEAGHLIYGYRDVYDVVTGLPTVGYWSLMDVGNLLGNAITFPSGTAVFATGLLPPSVDPWQKRLIYPDVPAARFPTYGTEEALANSAEGFEVLQVPLSGEEYLLLENRLDDLNGNGQLTLFRDPATGVILGPAFEDTLEYDFLVPGPGILAWHVDESVADYFGPRADPGFGLNVNRGRFGLEILEADGLDDLGDFDSPFALGVPSDTWKEGPNSRLAFDTVPRLRSHSRTDPHLELRFTSPPGPTMSLTVTRQWDLPGWPVRVTQPPGGIAPAVAGMGGLEPATRVAWSGGDSALHVRFADGTAPFAGGTSDVAFAAPGPLGPVAVVPSTGRSLYVVARADTAPPSGGLVYAVDVSTPVPAVSSYLFPSRITAGPTGSALAPDRVLVGLENGRVCEIRTDTQAVRDLVGVGAEAVTGLALAGDTFAAAGRSGALVTGQFDGGGAGASYTTSLRAGAMPAGRHLQPLLLPNLADGGRVAVVDRTRGSVRTYALVGDDPEPSDPPQGRELGEAVGPPALSDLDDDGLPEIAFLAASGRLGDWNLNGSLSPGWPPELEREGFASGAGPLVLEHPSLSPDPLVVGALGNGVLVAVDRARRNPAGFPLGLSVGARGTPALDVGPNPPRLFVAGGDTLLYGFGLETGASAPPPATSGWSAEGGDAHRSYTSPASYGSTVGGASPIVAGSLRAYPNPARRQPITFAFRLRAAGRATVSIYDAAARLVERFERDASASDNALTWDPAGRASGLYVARIEVPGQVVTVPFALVR